MAYGEADIPDQRGRLAIVTGGSGGLGWETARMLAKAGAHVVIAARSPTKAADAVARLRAVVPDASVEVQALDLASLANVREFCARWAEGGRTIDLLINNAGIMAVPHGRSPEGFELQLATNHLGHFALTMGLWPSLAPRAGTRVVNVSSGMHHTGRIRFDDLDGDRGYSPWPWYGQSKLANLLFTLELDRRLRAAGSPIGALAAHPGYAATELQGRTGNALWSGVMGVGNAIFAQSAAAGALPTVRAAVDPAAESGQYWGPGVLGWFGAPALSSRSAASRDAAVAAKLWEVSETRTGTRWPA